MPRPCQNSNKQDTNQATDTPMQFGQFRFSLFLFVSFNLLFCLFVCDNICPLNIAVAEILNIVGCSLCACVCIHMCVFMLYNVI